MDAFEVRDGTFAMITKGGYELSTVAATVYWFLLYNGIWQNGHQWFGHVNIAMTSKTVISQATGWSVKSIQRGLTELEATGFIHREARYADGGVQLSDSIEITCPGDWCRTCQKRGTHLCSGR